MMEAAEATVREMGAPEGVKVEGVRITGTRTLKGGEEIVAGPLRMTYLRRAKPVKGAIDAGKLGKKAPGAGHAILSCPRCGHVEFLSDSSPLLQNLELVAFDAGDGD